MDIFRGYKSGTLVENGLSNQLIHQDIQWLTQFESYYFYTYRAPAQIKYI